ncbi:MAG: HPF/RaiA family ribosome-associated protein [Myxococcales bacterium]|nr:HPF/RaiA family ribosome-associated protein [Myxococcales bacterium]
MTVLLKGVHVRMTDTLRAYVEKHLVRPLLHFYRDPAAELEIHLVDNNGPKGGLDKECRATVRMPGSRTIHVTEASDDLYQAVCFARDRLERLEKRAISRRREPEEVPEAVEELPPLPSVPEIPRRRKKGTGS